MKKIIIGAGPAGLYTAIKLKKAGISDVIIYDPRAGQYTRPGHLSPNVFAKAEEGLGFQFWDFEKTGHIKDLERALYEEAMRLGIRIEKKRFLRLHENEKKPGVVLANEQEEEIVEADYVFDCTGTRREVVAAVHDIIPDRPFKLTPITNLPVRNHFLAYVKISKKEWNRFEINADRIKYFPETIDALSFVRSILKLRALGWKEFRFPRCYGAEFGKDKICLYLHAPEHLDPTHYDTWVQTVLECYTKPIKYTHLPPSSKPRFLPFSSNAQVLNEVSYKGKNLPMIIPLGDSQIDFDYYLAHGICDGMVRIDALFEHMNVSDNEINLFDADEYMQSINKLLVQHKEEVIRESAYLKQLFRNALAIAEIKFKQALALCKNTEEKAVLGEFLKEIEVRQNETKAHRVILNPLLEKHFPEIERKEDSCLENIQVDNRKGFIEEIKNEGTSSLSDLSLFNSRKRYQLDMTFLKPPLP